MCTVVCPSSKASPRPGRGPFRCAWGDSRCAASRLPPVGTPGFLGTIWLVSARLSHRKGTWPQTLDPGTAEWAVLDILWSQGPCTVAEVAQHLGALGQWSAGAAPALLARLLESGLVRYTDRRRRPMHVQATVSKAALQEELCRRFAERHFAGDLRALAHRVHRCLEDGDHRGSSSSEMSQLSKLQG